MKQRLLSALLALMMLISLLPVTAWTAEPQGNTTQEQEYISDTADMPDNDELFAGYIQSLLYADIAQGSRPFRVPSGNRLDADSKAVYNLLKAEITKIANGERADTIISVSGSETAWEKILLILDCLRVDCPYEMYWNDKTVSTSLSYSGSNITVPFYVAQAYSATNEKGTTQMKTTGIGNIVEKVKANAKAVVEANAGKSTYEKLAAYKKYICEQVEYNYDALQSGTPYGDPWQLIYVFDEDPTTNVVCEGYSKAFQYLCDLTEDLGADCYTVCGIMRGGTGSGGHMWNIVRLNSNSYLVDVTNCDGMSIGAPNKLFMVGKTSGSASGGYQLDCGTNQITYEYYDRTSGTGHTDQFTLMDETILTLADKNYKDPSAPASIEVKYTEPKKDGTHEGNPYFMVPTISALGTDKQKTVKIRAVDRDTSGNVISGKTIEWAVSPALDGVTLTANSDSTATLIISNSAIHTYNPSYMGGYPITVTAMCGTTTGEQRLGIWVSHRSPAFIQILKGTVPIATDKIAPGSSTVYGAKVYDQYGMEMSGQLVSWSVPEGNGVSVNSSGKLTVGTNATGNYTITATSGAATASLMVTVSQTSTDHNFGSDWERDETNHWHACTDTGCDETADRAAHTWNAGEVTTDPTYEAEGEKTFTCTVCRQTKTEPVSKLEHHFDTIWSKDNTYHWHACTDPDCSEITDKAEHSWDSGIITTQPTYDDDGIKTYTCTECQQAKTETVSPLKHTYSNVWSKNDENHWHACIDPGYENLTKDNAPHTWDEGKVTSEPTADTEGIKTYTCNICDHTRAETIGATGHNYSDVWSTSETEHWKACTDAGCTGVSMKAAHTWKSDVILEPTYDAAGSRTLTCTICEYSKTEEIPRKEHNFSSVWSSDGTNHWHACTEEGCAEKEHVEPHNWDNGVITTPPSYESAGMKTFTCEVCEKKKIETVAQMEHHYSDDWSKDTDHHWHVCTDTGYTELFKDKTAHIWDSGTITIEPTTDTEGVKTFKCTVCGQTRTEAVGQLGHNYSPNWSSDTTHHWHACTDEDCTELSERNEHTWDNGTITTQPTETTSGVRTFVCTVCGRTRTETLDLLEPAVPPHTHIWAAAWSSNETHHWHNCTVSGCNIVENSEKSGYSAHIYDGNADMTCNICGHTRYVTPPAVGFTITFAANGGTIAYNTDVTGTNGKLTDLPSPARNGHTFEGWYTSASGGAKITKDYVFTSNTTVYAHWTQNNNESSENKPSDSNESDGSSVSHRGSGKPSYKPGSTTSTPSSSPDAPASSTRFTDAPTDAYYFNAVTWAEANGIVSGTGGKKFKPDEPCTRAQILTFLWRAAGSPVVEGNNHFTDVPADSYYHDAVEWAVSQGIAKGLGKKTFRPNEPCTRGQAVTFLHRASGSADESKSSRFADVLQDAYYSNAVQWAVNNDIAKGMGAKKFNPDGPCTRAQIVTFLYRDRAR